jgi:hypothetical protein
MIGNIDRVIGYLEKLLGDFDKLLGDFDKLPGDFYKLLGDFDKLPGDFDKLIGDFKKVLGNFNGLGVLVCVTASTCCLSARADDQQPALRAAKPIEQTVRRSVDLTPAVPLVPALEPKTPDHTRIDHKEAKRLARDHWLEKSVAASPDLIAAITQYRDAAKALAKHPKLGDIAAADHYLCRQITKWKSASRTLARNREAKTVIEYDPEGIYVAIKRDKSVAHILTKNPEFNQMIVDNPDLGKVMASCF